MACPVTLNALLTNVPVQRPGQEGFARVVLERPIDMNQAALRFSPLLDGRGIHPVGRVHHFRIDTYAASQAARPTSDGPFGLPRWVTMRMRPRWSKRS